jgi:hypothetical protein
MCRHTEILVYLPSTIHPANFALADSPGGRRFGHLGPNWNDLQIEKGKNVPDLCRFHHEIERGGLAREINFKFMTLVW